MERPGALSTIRSTIWIALLLLSQVATGQTWTPQFTGITQQINSIWGTSASNIWAGHAANLLRFDGAAWQPVFGVSGATNGIWGTDASNIWAATSTGTSGRIFKYNGSSWTQESFGIGINYAIWGFDPFNIWVGGVGYIRRFNGFSWTSEPVGGTLRGIWGTNPVNVWAVGYSGLIRKYDGNTWTTQTSGTPQDLFGVWGVDANNIWAVGAAGTILKYNGTSWVAQNSGTTQQLNGIWGIDANNIWAVGNLGTILKYNGTSWVPQTSGTSNVLKSVWGTGTQFWVTGAGGLILYSGNQNIILPVELVHFQARLQPNQTALLLWKTASEHHNAGFDIERSADGKTWEMIGFAAGQGNASEEHVYRFTDARPLPGDNYYRLAQLDMDGERTYSDIRILAVAGSEKAGLQVFPNPVTQGELTVQLSGEPDENTVLHVYSDDGRLLLQQPVPTSLHRTSLYGWAPGVYLVEVKNAGSTWREKVVVGN